MTQFKSWQSYWEFRRAIIERTRYVHDPAIEQFLDAVVCTHHCRVETIAADTVLWRAQLGHDSRPCFEGDDQVGTEPVPFSPERMKPVRAHAREGRANPKGIPYLYLATHRDTALAEVRPWVGSFISVGAFKANRQLSVVNCTSDEKGTVIYFKEPSPQERETAVWCDIDRAFARPVTLSDDVTDYVPTQVIAELFKVQGHDGVAYRSSVGEGHNVALFDLQVADLVGCMLFEVKSIRFDFREAGHRYSVVESPGKGQELPNHSVNTDG